MICFFCKAEIESDHGCQEIAEFMEGPATVEEVAEIRVKMQQSAARRAK